MEWDKTSFEYPESEDLYILEKERHTENKNVMTAEATSENTSESRSLERKAAQEKITSLEKTIQERDATINKLKKIMESASETTGGSDDKKSEEIPAVHYIQVDEKILDENGKAEEIYHR